jgi:hypothetical protein
VSENGTTITADDVMTTIDEWGFGFSRLDERLDGVNQYVYRAKFDSDEMIYPTDINVDFYTTVDVRSEEARTKGNASMKLRFTHTPSGDGAAPTQRFYRTSGWAGNVREKLLDFLTWTQVPPLCPDCASLLLWKSSSNGHFWGCSAYDGGDGCDFTASTDEYGPF